MQNITRVPTILQMILNNSKIYLGQSQKVNTVNFSVSDEKSGQQRMNSMLTSLVIMLLWECSVFLLLRIIVWNWSLLFPATYFFQMSKKCQISIYNLHLLLLFMKKWHKSWKLLRSTYQDNKTLTEERA